MGYAYRQYKQTYRCGGQASYHGSCGAYDCESCHPGCGSEQTTNRDLSDTHEYEPDSGKWIRVVCVKKHTARRDHKDGRIKKGQTYRKTTIRIVDDETGESHHIHRKVILKGAAS